MEALIGTDELKRLMKLPGDVRGVVFKTDFDYVRGLRGEEGVGQLSEAFRAVGQPLDYDQIVSMDFYPIGLRIISLLLIKKLFTLTDGDIKKIGIAAPKLSLIIKLFTKYFPSITLTASQAPTMWLKHYRAGNLVVREISEKDKRIVLRLENLTLNPIFCKYLEGYFLTVVHMVVGSATTSSEIACPFRGDLAHEYLLTWQ